MKALIFKVLFIFFLILSFLNAQLPAQDQKRIDSLSYQLEIAKNDSSRIYMMVAISKEYAANDLTKALQFAEKALELAEKFPNKDFLPYVLFNLGIVYFNQGLVEFSVKYFFRYLEIQKEKKDKSGTAYALVNLGAIHLKLGQFKQSKEYFENALGLFNQLAEDNKSAIAGAEVISIYNNLGVVSKNCNEPGKAIEYYTRGISLARQTPGQETFLANLLNNLGSIYLDQDNATEALKYLQEAFDVRFANDDKSGLVKSYLMLSNYYFKNNEEEKALLNLYQGYSLANQVGALSSLAEIFNMLFEIYNKKQLADSALKYHILLTSFNEKLNKEAAIKELANLELKSQIQEKEKLQQSEQKRKDLRYMMIGLALVLLLSISSLLFFLSQSRVRRLRLEKENIKLVSKNLELEKSNLMQELELKNKELATNVMYQIQKNELIHEIGQKLYKHSHSISKDDQTLIIGIIKDLEKTQDTNIWNEFEVRFQQVHNEFYNKLNEINPELSPNDRRLCAFLRLNMTTKEIGSITGQSPRSIEVARWRLRKKLNLTNSETGLITFLSKL